MDLSRTSNVRKLYLCKWYFKVGFALLPFVWAINAAWFFDEAFRKPIYDEQKSIKKYVLLSALGALIWLGIIIAWCITFQQNRAEWGSWGDSLSLIIPLGRA